MVGSPCSPRDSQESSPTPQFKTSILQHSAFFIVQLSHPYMTSRKTIALITQTFVDKVMSLLFNMLSRLVITFLPRSKCFLISGLQSPSAVILEPRKIKPLFPPSICLEHYQAPKETSYPLTVTPYSPLLSLWQPLICFSSLPVWPVLEVSCEWNHK